MGRCAFKGILSRYLLFHELICSTLTRVVKEYQRNECVECRENPRKGQRLCLACHAAYIRAWRKMNRLTGEALRKARCRSFAYTYWKRGKLERLACELCGNVNSQMHHSDYSKPLEVTWLCRHCHLSWHKTADRL